MRTACLLILLISCSSQPESQKETGDTSTGPSPNVELAHLKSGRFEMGCTAAQIDYCDNEEKPTREVVLTRSFWMSTTEITQEFYRDLTGDSPSEFKDCARCPVEYVSWNMAAEFAVLLSKKEGLESCYRCREGGCEPAESILDCTGYRLPTEAEWEYAARCESDFLYAGGDDAFGVAWTRHNSLNKPHPVGELQPNDCGLYDMSGNVWEWVHDGFAPYTQAETTDPTGPDVAEMRTLRGGAFNQEPSFSRLSNRFDILEETENNVGFRLVRSDIP